jgi:predicted SAM-dependent methyltransferase
MPVPDRDYLDGVASQESVSQDVDRETSEEDMKLNKLIGYEGPMARMNHVLKVDSARINNTIKKLISESFKPNQNFNFYHAILDNEFAKNNLENFDITFSFHVLEHVYNMKGFINNMFSITKKGGVILIEVPNEDDDLCKFSENYKKIIHFPSHVSCFTKKTLTKLVEESGIIDKVELSFIPIQRYGYFNYVDWLRYDDKQKVYSDDYVPREKRSWIEEHWLKTKKENFTTDSIAMVIKKK